MPKARTLSTAANIQLITSPVSKTEIEKLNEVSFEDSGAYRTKLVAESTDSDYRAHIARDSAGEIIGGVMYTSRTRTGAYGYPVVIMPNIGVLEKARGTGLGNALLKQAAKYAASKNAGIELIPTKEAEGFYTRLGFTGDFVMTLSPSKTAQLARGR